MELISRPNLGMVVDVPIVFGHSDGSHGHLGNCGCEVEILELCESRRVDGWSLKGQNSWRKVSSVTRTKSSLKIYVVHQSE